MIYLIGATLEIGDLVKIGTSVQPLARLKSLQTGCPNKIAILALVPGGHAFERTLHRRYARERVSGEWFKVSPRLREWALQQVMKAPQMLAEALDQVAPNKSNPWDKELNVNSFDVIQGADDLDDRLARYGANA